MLDDAAAEPEFGERDRAARPDGARRRPARRHPATAPRTARPSSRYHCPARLLRRWREPRARDRPRCRARDAKRRPDPTGKASVPRAVTPQRHAEAFARRPRRPDPAGARRAELRRRALRAGQRRSPRSRSRCCRSSGSTSRAARRSSSRRSTAERAEPDRRTSCTSRSRSSASASTPAAVPEAQITHARAATTSSSRCPGTPDAGDDQQRPGERADGLPPRAAHRRRGDRRRAGSERHAVHAARVARDARRARSRRTAATSRRSRPYLQDLYDALRLRRRTRPRRRARRPTEPLVTCSTDGTAKYLLGPVEVDGHRHLRRHARRSRRHAGRDDRRRGSSTSRFDGTGTTEFATISARLVGLDRTPQNQFAIVLDGTVISAPTVERRRSPTARRRSPAASPQEGVEEPRRPAEVRRAAGQLQGASQNDDLADARRQRSCIAGLIAGLIGLILVVRLLGAPVPGARVRGASRVARRLRACSPTSCSTSCPGGRATASRSPASRASSSRSASRPTRSSSTSSASATSCARAGASTAPSRPAGSARFRTILASDAVNFLAAAVLFVLAVGDVQGFALTLGLTTLIDVVVVALFTHPMLQLLARTAVLRRRATAFSGLDPQRARCRLPRPRPVPRARRSPAARRAAAARRSAARPSRSARPPSSGDGTGKGRD